MLKAIVERSSVRSYTDKVISEGDIKKILEAGRLAPSWMNVQPWHFISIQDQETKDLLCTLSFGQKQVKNASHVILCLADVGAWDDAKFRKVLKGRGNTDEQIDAIFQNETLYPKLKGEEKVLLRTAEQCSYAISHMILEAENLGISSCIIGALGNEFTQSNQEVYTQIREKLEIPEKMYLMTMITLGYNAKPEMEVKKLRKDFNEVVSSEKFGQTF